MIMLSYIYRLTLLLERCFTNVLPRSTNTMPLTSIYHPVMFITNSPNGITLVKPVGMALNRGPPLESKSYDLNYESMRNYKI